MQSREANSLSNLSGTVLKLTTFFIFSCLTQVHTTVCTHLQNTVWIKWLMNVQVLVLQNRNIYVFIVNCKHSELRFEWAPLLTFRTSSVCPFVCLYKLFTYPTPELKWMITPFSKRIYQQNALNTTLIIAKASLGLQVKGTLFTREDGN